MPEYRCCLCDHLFTRVSSLKSEPICPMCGHDEAIPIPVPQQTLREWILEPGIGKDEYFRRLSFLR